MTLQLELVTPARRVLSQPVDEVRAPGALGSFGVLPNHADFVTSLKPGELIVVSSGQTQRFAIGEGFAQVSKNKVLILAEIADRAEEIDLAGANAEHDAAVGKLANMRKDTEDYEQQRAGVERAAARAKVAGRKN
jgi:F-type H+-transporting ATPase subunit epsilon